MKILEVLPNIEAKGIRIVF